jgi:hypothetical protein
VPYSQKLTINDKEVVFCVCGVIADGLFRGSTLHPEADRVIPMNRYLCVQCAQDNKRNGLKTARVKRLTYPEDMWETFGEILREANDSGVDFFAYFDQWEQAQRLTNYPYYYAWKNNSKRATLYKRRFRVLNRGKMNTAVAEFENGQKEAISRNAIRKVK